MPAAKESSIIFLLQLKYKGGFGDNFRDEKQWHRNILIQSRTTLEYLSCIITNIMNWDHCHLYYFVVDKKNYIHNGLDELILEDGIFDGPCFSCDIRLCQLGISIEDEIQFNYDYGDEHIFTLKLLDVIENNDNKKNYRPGLISFNGKNITQYPEPDEEFDLYGIRFEEETPRLDFTSLNCLYNESYKQLYKNVVRFISVVDHTKLLKMRKSNNKREWNFAVTLLESRSLCAKEISEKIEISEERLIKWIKTYNAFGLSETMKSRRRNANSSRQVKLKKKIKRVLEILHHPPSAFDINRSNWSQSAIAKAYKNKYEEPISTATVGRIIRDEGGYKFSKAKQVLTSSDPNYAEKVNLLVTMLQSLKHDEDLFFIDEMGPIRVKKHGGRSYTKKGETKWVSSNPVNRGSVIFSAALSAKKNQVTMIYGRSKNSPAMIDLIEVIYNQYYQLSKIYVTWDAASWHKSNELIDWLNSLNQHSTKINKGPLIEFIPLPSCAQFLNVIESVFSSMKRAVIHLSNYKSPDEMKSAISKHFRNRNNYYKENPKRAGNKIWNIDFFSNSDNIRSGNYREW